ncbi:hypothetical protein R1sor_019098 [Riccia sorocarpa]|uniref:Uncharacterized protein n=1 Tax=Riccia sorocarpa TaxID=122646 RepID=A0ABD3IC41_9MARC
MKESLRSLSPAGIQSFFPRQACGVAVWNCSGAVWAPLFWSLWRGGAPGVNEKRLMLDDLPSPRGAMFFRKMGLVWLEVKKFLYWRPPDLSLPDQITIRRDIELLRLAGFLSVGELQGVLSLPWTQLPWTSLPELVQGDVGLDQALVTKLQSVTTFRGSFSFHPTDWKILFPGKAPRSFFPLTVAGSYSLTSAVTLPVRTEYLNKKWALHWPPDWWKALFKLLWNKGVPRREGIFLWRVLYKTFWTGSRGAKIEKKLQTHSDPDSLHLVAKLSPPDRLATTLLLGQAFRCYWKRRCSLMFEGAARELSWGGVLISTAEILLAQAKHMSDRRRDFLKRALLPILEDFPGSPNQIFQQYDRIFGTSGD